MRDVQNQRYIVLSNTVDNDVIVGREAAQARAEIAVAAAADVGISSQEPETLGDALHHTGGDIGATALAGDVNPDAVKVGFRLGRKTKLAHSAEILLGGKACRATPLDVGCKLGHVLMRCDSTALTPC
jgi:hypothetical protein